MKVLLTHSYFMQFDPKQVRHAMPYAPLGTLYAAALLRENGHEVSLFDTMFAHSSDELMPVFDSIQPEVLVIYDDGFNYLTKMCLTNMREAAFRMQEYAASKGCKVIVASSDSTDHYAKYIEHRADYVIIGEAEYTLLELMNVLHTNTGTISDIMGLAYFNGSEIVKTNKRVIKKDLDSMPLPAWDLVDIAPYKKVWMEKHGYFSVNIATTRGCPYKCNWCAKPIYGNIYNMRSPEHVVKELALIKTLFHFDHIWFCDDIFGLKPEWVIHFAELVNKENIHFKYKIQSRADLLVKEKYVEALALSGCDEVWMGAESGSQKILDAMDKGTTIEQIVEARQLLKQHGIKAAYFLQYGYPGEELNDIQKTIQLVKDTMPDDIGISVSYPLPGTVFYERVKQDLKTKANWSDSDELAMMFHNTYQPGFYKTLHRLTHSIYRQYKALNILKTKTISMQWLHALLTYVKYVLLGQLQRFRLKQTL
ncbi:MAG: radical SAM protein [Bacteroidota bacterium]